MKSVYLDHCVISKLSKDASTSWRDIGVGNVLARAIDEGRAEVWTSPTEVMEVCLWANFDDHGHLLDTSPEDRLKLDCRCQAARNVLAMTDAKRMAPAYEFIVVEEFLDNLDKLAPGAVITRMHFDLFKETSVQSFLGILGLLGSHRHFGGAAAMETMLRAKITSRLLHSRFVKEPSKFVDSVVECAREFRTTTKDIWDEYEQRSISDLQNEIDENQSQSVKLDNKAKTRLQKNKRQISEAYGAAELGQCLTSVFKNGFYLLSTFDMDVIKQQWGNIMGNPESKAPAFLGPEDSDKCVDDIGARIRALEILFRTFATDRLFVSVLPTLVILGELEMCLGAGELPTGGLTYDAQHAAMLKFVDVFVTHDKRLANNARRAAARIAETGLWNVQIATDENGLAAALS